MAAPIKVFRMTLRAQIQDHASVAGAKIRDAMQEFSNATGLAASVDVRWLEQHRLESALPEFLVSSVTVRFDDAAVSR